MSLADRLRSVVRPGEPAKAGPCDNDCRGRFQAAQPETVAELLGGECREWHGQPYVVVDRKYPPGHRHGRIAVADSAPGQDDSWPALAILEPAFAKSFGEAGGRVLFIDLETTGLAGGAGTYAFLVGCGWFDGATFCVRQFLLAGYAAERGLLEEVADLAGGAGALATYNGKTFDLPLIETRFLLHRMATPFGDVPHIDMLHCARRLWPPARVPRFGEPHHGGPHERTAQPALARRVASRPDLGEGGRSEARSSDVGPTDRQPTCRLTAIEETVLGHVREDDVPGFEIPSRYFHYVRSGDARPLEAVLEHNRLDLLSLAMLTARAAELLEQGAQAARTACEALGLGRLYQRGGMLTEARACFDCAATMDAAGETLARVEALRAYAVLSRRLRQYEDAAGAWRRILELHPCPPALAQEATEALAVHHEHRRRELHEARQFALQSLQFNTSVTRTQAVHHRLARLDRKLACPEPSRTDGPTSGPAPLF